MTSTPDTAAAVELIRRPDRMCYGSGHGRHPCKRAGDAWFPLAPRTYAWLCWRCMDSRRRQRRQERQRPLL